MKKLKQEINNFLNSISLTEFHRNPELYKKVQMLRRLVTPHDFGDRERDDDWLKNYINPDYLLIPNNCINY